MQSTVEDLLDKRCKRACRSILEAKEKFADPTCSDENSQRLRSVILDQVNDFYKLCLDVIESVDTGVVVNELYLHKLDQIHRFVTEEFEFDENLDD
jgi:hypothetical protein